MGLNKKKLFTISVIGAGHMAEEHIKAIKKFKKLKIVGIMCKNHINSKKLANKYNIQYVCKDIKELYEKTLSKALIVAVPVSETKKIIIKSLKYSWKILSEKPLGLNFNESKEILKKTKIQKKQKDIVVGFNRRNYDTTRYVLSNIKNNKEKRLVQINDQQNLCDDRIKRFKEKIKKNWMYANSTHLIDYANIFCRGKIIYMKRKILTLEKKNKIFTFYAKYSSGDVLLYNALWNMPGPWSVTLSNRFRSYKLEPLEKLKFKDLKSKKYVEIKQKKNKYKLQIKFGLYNQTNEFLKFIEGKTNYLCSIEDSHKTMQLTKKIYS